MMARLGSFLKLAKRSVEVHADDTYRQIGVRVWGKGSYVRETITGRDTQYKLLFQVRAGDLIINKIWTRNGAIAIVPNAQDGCFVSTEFPTFEIDATKADSSWLNLRFSTEDFWHKCALASGGTSGKNRIKVDKFLDIEIELPEIATQKQIASRANHIFEKYSHFQNIIDKNVLIIQKIKTALFDYLINTMESHYANLSDLASIKGGKRLPKGESFSVEPTSHIYLRVADMKNGSVDSSKLKYIDNNTFEKIKNYTITSSDLYASIAGTIGEVGEIPDFLSGSSLTENAAKIIPIKASKKYLFYALKSASAKKQMHSFVNRMAQPKLALKRLGAVKIPTLSSSDERLLLIKITKISTLLEAISDINIKNSKTLDSIKDTIFIASTNA